MGIFRKSSLGNTWELLSMIIVELPLSSVHVHVCTHLPISPEQRQCVTLSHVKFRKELC